MPSKEYPRCGIFQPPGRYHQQQRDGCGGPVTEDGHLLRWYIGEDFTVYHQRCFEKLNLPQPVKS